MGDMEKNFTPPGASVDVPEILLGLAILVGLAALLFLTPLAPNRLCAEAIESGDAHRIEMVCVP